MKRQRKMILETQDLKKYYPITGGVFKKEVGQIKAVDGVSLKIERGECLGLVGESGCGKTTFGKTLLRLLEPTSGHIYFDIPGKAKVETGEKKRASSPDFREPESYLKRYDLATLKGTELKNMRKRMQIVFQDPSSSLNPRMLVKDIIGEPLKVHGLARGLELRKRVLELLNRVGLTSDHLFRYPHEFSGGQRQRIAIARALATDPDFIVLDEPTSALDVSVQAQILNLLQDLQEEFGLTYLFITHHLLVVEYISHRIAVMYLGRIVELADTKELFGNPLHPYTQALLSAIPIPDPEVRSHRTILKGDVPSPIAPPPGCVFHTRCFTVAKECEEGIPDLVPVGREHYVACRRVKSKSKESPRL
jgi:oligopeptide/dipeptide ABC transporter ATP-binding protein